jgi:hypothetical protein
MQIQDVKRWQWAGIALIIGLAFSFAWSNYSWEQQYPTLGPVEFERGLTIPTGRIGHIADIEVLPPIEDKYVVFCTQVRRLPSGGSIARPVAVVTNIPYKSLPSGKSYPNVLAFLQAEQASHPLIHYSFAWYRQTWAIYILCIAGSLLLIGGIWPSVVSLLTGGGLGLSRKRKEPDYDLDRFATGEKAEAPRAAPNVTHQDLDEVRRLDDELEKQLAGSAAPAAGAAVGTAPASEQGIRKLDGGPLEASQVQKEDLKKEYGGEYYPVVKSTHKKAEPPPAT